MFSVRYGLLLCTATLAVARPSPRRQLAFVNDIANGFEDLGNGIADGFEDVGTGIADGVADTGDWFEDTGTSIGDGFMGGLTDTGDWFEDAGTSIGDGFVDGLTDAGNWFEDTGNLIGDGFMDGLADTGDWFEDVGTSIGDGFMDGLRDVGDWFEGAGSDIEDATNGAVNAVGNELDNLGSELESLGDEIGSTFEDLGADWLEGVGQIGDWFEGVGSDVGDWFEGDFVDFWEQDFAGFWDDVGSDVGDWFEGDFVDFWEQDFAGFWEQDFVDFWEKDFVDFWEEDFVNFWEKDVPKAMGEGLQAMGIGPDKCDVCRSKGAEEPARFERCFTPIAEQGFCNTEKQQFAVEGCIDVAAQCGECYSDSACSASTESYDPIEEMCTEGESGTQVAICFATTDATSTSSTPGFCNADTQKFANEGCIAAAEHCRQYYPDSACSASTESYDPIEEMCTEGEIGTQVAMCFATTDAISASSTPGFCNADTQKFASEGCIAAAEHCRQYYPDSVCSASTESYDPMEAVCLASARRCFEPHTNDNGLCHAEHGLFVDSACSVGQVNPHTGKRAKSIAVTCGKFFPESRCSGATAALAEEQMQEYNREQLCATPVCSSASRCYQARGDDGDVEGFCDASTGLFLVAQCQDRTACAECYPESPCVDATEPVPAAQPTPVEQSKRKEQKCATICERAERCWIPDTEHDENGKQGLCDSDTKYFMHQKCSEFVVCAECFEQSPCNGATGTAPQVDTTSTTTETSTTSVTTATSTTKTATSMTTVSTTSTTKRRPAKVSTVGVTTTKARTTKMSAPRAPVENAVIELGDMEIALHNLFQEVGLDAAAADIVDEIGSKVDIHAAAKAVDHDLGSLIKHAAVVDVLEGLNLSDDIIDDIAEAASQFENDNEEVSGVGGNSDTDSATTTAVTTLVTLFAVVAAAIV